MCSKLYSAQFQTVVRPTFVCRSNQTHSASAIFCRSLRKTAGYQAFDLYVYAFVRALRSGWKRNMIETIKRKFIGTYDYAENTVSTTI